MCFRPPDVNLNKVCPECGAENDFMNLCCQECGAELPEDMGNAPAMPGAAPGMPVAPGMPPAPGMPKAPGQN